MKKKIIISVIAIIIFAAATLTVFSGLNNTLSGSSKNKMFMTESASPLMGAGIVRDSSKMAYVSQNAGVMEVATPNVPEETTIDKKIVKMGTLGLKVANVDETSGLIASIAKENGGDVFSSNLIQSSAKVKSGTITIKVPADKFDATMAEIKKIAVLVLNEYTSGSDVTEQYIDLQARIKNKKAEEESYVKILASAQKIDDVIAVTRQLSQVRGEIERLEGQIRYMDSETDMSTLSINLSEDQTVTFVDTWRPFQFMKDTVNELFKDFRKFIDFLIVLIIRIIPVFALYGLIVFAAYKIGNKIYGKFKDRKTGNSAKIE